MSKTKLVSMLMMVSAAIDILIDVFNGGGFQLKDHATALISAANGAGFYFLRDAVAKLEGAFGKI